MSALGNTPVGQMLDAVVVVSDKPVIVDIDPSVLPSPTEVDVNLSVDPSGSTEAKLPTPPPVGTEIPPHESEAKPEPKQSKFEKGLLLALSALVYTFNLVFSNPIAVMALAAVTYAVYAEDSYNKLQMEHETTARHLKILMSREMDASTKEYEVAFRPIRSDDGWFESSTISPEKLKVTNAGGEVKITAIVNSKGEIFIPDAQTPGAWKLKK